MAQESLRQQTALEAAPAPAAQTVAAPPKQPILALTKNTTITLEKKTASTEKLSSREEIMTDSLSTQSETEAEAEDEEQDSGMEKGYMKTVRGNPVKWRTRHEISDSNYQDFPDNELLPFERKEKYRRLRLKKKEEVLRRVEEAEQENAEVGGRGGAA